MAASNTHQGINMYTMQPVTDKNKKGAQKVINPQNMNKSKYNQNFKERSSSALTMQGSAEQMKAAQMAANRQTNNVSA